MPSADVRLALAAALERVAAWSGGDPRDDAVAVRAGRELERQVRLAVVASVKRLRAEGRTWRDLAALLGLDSESLGTPIADQAELAFAYCAGLPRAPTFAPAVPHLAMPVVRGDGCRPRARRQGRRGRTRARRWMPAPHHP
jgi:hypothetical protein